jgi:hypothetical protein
MLADKNRVESPIYRSASCSWIDRDPAQFGCVMPFVTQVRCVQSQTVLASFFHHDNRYYLLDRLFHLPLRTQIAWCETCQEFTEMEWRQGRESDGRCLECKSTVGLVPIPVDRPTKHPAKTSQWITCTTCHASVAGCPQIELFDVNGFRIANDEPQQDEVNAENMG